MKESWNPTEANQAVSQMDLFANPLCMYMAGLGLELNIL